MGNTVYAENMGFFHKGSGGKGVAPGDVCLSPPPPPAGPMPVPYVNVAQAADLAKGSKTVKIQGNPTALENASHVSTSTGNEGGTQGGGVVTHKTKGKASFMLWSFTVKAEGKGICRNGDPMEQNTASPLPNCTAPGALVNLKAALGDLYGKPCHRKYRSKKHRPSIKAAQKKKVRGQACWECKKQINAGKKPLTPGGRWLGSKKQYDNVEGGRFAGRDRKAMTVDHQPPLGRAWELGGCHLGTKAFKKLMSKPKFARPHCYKHYQAQGSKVNEYVKKMRSVRG